MAPPIMNDRIMSLPKGWIVIYKDGSLVVEGEMPWKKVVKRQIASLHLKWHDRFWDLYGKDSYVCFQRRSIVVSSAGEQSSAEIAARCIGFYDELGRKIIYAVDEFTGKMSLRIKEG